jgi:esterase/lipase superfamily enzyme
MRREVWTVPAPEIGSDGTVIAYGHWGTPVLFFPAEGGRSGDLEANGIIDALAVPLEQGRLKVYAVDTYDQYSWSDTSLPSEERARRHEGYHHWVIDQVAPTIHGDCGGAERIVTAGISMGAFHAVNVALRRADLFPHAVGMSGNYDPSTWHPWGERGDVLYFNNPFAYLANANGDHLQWLQHSVFIQLVVGSGEWEHDPTWAYESTTAFSDLLGNRGIPHQLDVWGEDTPHDWPSWRRMVAAHIVPLAEGG